MEFRMSFLTASYSGKGGRPLNEDSIYYNQIDDKYIAIVADGLGMHGGGDIASAAVVDTISKKFLDKASIEKEDICEYFSDANCAVLEKQTTSCKMKSTAAALFSKNNQLVFAHVGDSRLYHFSRGKKLYQSFDHSVSQMAVVSGEIDASQIRFHEDRNRLLRALGGSEDVRPEIVQSQSLVNTGDAFLLCSDGFWEYVLESEMEIDLTKSETPEQWLSFMLKRVGNRIDGKNDNISAIAIIYNKG